MITFFFSYPNWGFVVDGLMHDPSGSRTEYPRNYSISYKK